MDSILRAAAIYAGLLLIMRITGKRSLAQITTFDFILLLLISEATQQALLGEDFSMTNAFLVIITLVSLDIGLSLLTFRSSLLSRLINGTPLVVVENGVPLRERMNKARLSESDIMEEARRTQGLERLDQIKYAVLEKGGGISVIPKQQA
ncbi:MAG: DUF421 domain-containing protein [Dehalococcoidia bacterium]|nr:DUF421 domain-containing protein [Dehalococcoidia bacterium]